MATKLCKRCKIIKNENEFYFSTKSLDHLAYYCKDCQYEMRRKTNLAHKNTLKNQREAAWNAKYLTPYQHLIQSGHYKKSDLINKTDEELLDMMWQLEGV